MSKASIRKFMPAKKTIATSIDGFYIKALSISESKALAKEHAALSQEDLQKEDVSKELTMKLFSLACDESGEPFEEFETYESIEQLSIEEFNIFANAIKEAMVPGAVSEKK